MNKYDDVRLDIPQLLSDQTLKLPQHDPSARSADSLSPLEYVRSQLLLHLTRLMCKIGLYQKLTYSNLRLDWFHEFRDYWVGELGNRPIEPPDFYFLMGVYRQKFQDLGVPDVVTNQQLLRAWQDPRTIYSLFHYQYKIALNPLSVHRFVKYIPNGGDVCEYGCGLAPIATGLCRFYLHKNIRITCADIPTLMFHYTRWKFRERKFIRTLQIDPSDDAPLDGEFDTVFCMEVLEHVPRPMEVVKHLYSRLKSGGHFILDYVRSDAKGLDTASALRDRADVLKYVAENFNTVEGEILIGDRDMGTVVCKKS